MKQAKYEVTYGVVKVDPTDHTLEGHFTVNCNYDEQNIGQDDHTIQYSIVDFKLSIPSGQAYSGKTGYLEKNLGSGQTSFRLGSFGEGGEAGNITGFADNFTDLPDCMTLALIDSGDHQPVPGIGLLVNDNLGKHRIQFIKAEILDADQLRSPGNFRID